MNRFLQYLFVGVISIFLLVGCAKQPTEEINAAQSAVDAVKTDGMKYAADETKKISDDLDAALNEIKTQDGKFLKNYSKAKEMLAKVKADAEALNSELAAKKEKAKQNALSAYDAAKKAVHEAKTLLSKVPKKKKTKKELEALKADIKGLEGSLKEVQTLIDSEDYITATQKAAALKVKAADISDKMKAKKTAKKKTVSKKK